MDYSAIPNVLAIGVVVVLSLPLLCFKNQFRLRYWLAGWLTVLFHALLMVFDSSADYGTSTRSLPQSLLDAGTDSSLALASVLFISATGIPRQAKRYLPLLAALPNLAAMVCWDVQIVSPTLYYCLMATGAAALCWAVEEGVFPWKGRPLMAYAAICGTYLAQALLLAFVSLDSSASWLLCWPYLTVAYLLLKNSPRATIGVTITSLSFVLWGLVFPLALMRAIYLPAVKIEMQIWNIPKFLAISGMILVLLEQQIDRMKDMAMRDALTDLPNRRAYMERVQEAFRRADRSGTKTALLLIDLDEFKRINDSLGHGAGDTVLQVVAGRLRKCLRDTDMLARMGGDEFAAILEGLAQRESAIRVIDSMRACLRDPILRGENTTSVTASIGLALYPDDGHDYSSLSAIADVAMYNSKAMARTTASILPQG